MRTLRPEWVKKNNEYPTKMKTPYTLVFCATEPQLPQLTCTWKWFASDANAYALIAQESPDVLCTIGENAMNFKSLCALPLSQRQRWLHFATADAVKERALMHCMMARVTTPPSQVLISVFTTSFKSKERIKRPWRSLLAQTYTNFEWIIVDDTDDDNGENWAQLQEICKTDFRFRAFKPNKHSGNIGALKRDAAMLCKGELLVELDHDDDIHPNTFAHLLAAYKEYPDAGMFWTDWCEVMETTDANWKYPEFCAFGYGSHTYQIYQGKWRIRMPSCPLNAKTLRYIVGVPNHLRVWTAKAYHEMGGHCSALHVVDDYELILRTFLKYPMVRIPRLCYVQYRNAGGNNFTFIRNAEIQKLTREVSYLYHDWVGERLAGLGMVDFNSLPSRPSWTFEDADLDARVEKIHVPPGFISYVIAVDGTHTQGDLETTLKSLDGLENCEVIVIGVRVPWLEQYLFKSADARLQWWNLKEDQSGTTVDDARRYGTKLVAIGQAVLLSPGQAFHHSVHKQ